MKTLQDLRNAKTIKAKRIGNIGTEDIENFKNEIKKDLEEQNFIIESMIIEDGQLKVKYYSESKEEDIIWNNLDNRFTIEKLTEKLIKKNPKIEILSWEKTEVSKEQFCLKAKVKKQIHEHFWLLPRISKEIEGILQFKSKGYMFIYNDSKMHGENLKKEQLIKDSENNIIGFNIVGYRSDNIGKYVFC